MGKTDVSLFNEEPRIKMFKYQGLLSNHLTMAKRIDQVFQSDASNVIEKMIERSTAELKAMVLKLFETYGEDTSKAEQETGINLATMLESHRASESEVARQYPQIICNQALVLMCATFDMFLEDTLVQIMLVNDNAVKGLASKEDVSIHDIISARDSNQVRLQIFQRILDRFDKGGVDKKLKYLKQAGLDTDDFLSLSMLPSAVQTTADEGRQKLDGMYAKRNDIAHKGTFPVTGVVELQEYSTFIFSLMFSLATICEKKFQIANDLVLRKPGR